MNFTDALKQNDLATIPNHIIRTLQMFFIVPDISSIGEEAFRKYAMRARSLVQNCQDMS